MSGGTSAASRQRGAEEPARDRRIPGWPGRPLCRPVGLAERLGRHTLPGLLFRSVRSYGVHACGIFAAAIAFFGVLSLFPLILLLIVLFSTLLQSSSATNLVLGT
ncbi:MAG: hypothetical protein ACYDAG_11745, partial [Chloroflexota bacterium]